MFYPKTQYVLFVVRGNRTRYFYGEVLKDIVLAHVKPGESYRYAKTVRGHWVTAKRRGAK